MENYEPADSPIIEVPDAGVPYDDSVEMDAPEYRFSGGNLGGQAVLVCGDCGALVMDPDTDGHTANHQAIGLGIGMRRVR